MTHTPSKRFLSLAFASLLCTMAVGCSPDAPEQPEPASESMPPESIEQVSSSAISCPDGWHPHYATWPAVGLYYPGQCSSKAATINNGWWVCMRSAGAASCGGQGYSDVFPAGSSTYYYWARTEAFDGH